MIQASIEGRDRVPAAASPKEDGMAIEASDVYASSTFGSS
jgi:hypothetical protein